ncbi:MAG: HAMP domain-containing histidine kinase [Candidatus Riflebacteria bacterium]|nr:HAMP domain-containing histidine kinase [Candidatus Riflebacteria bacterium]
MGHELKTPITVLLGYLHLLQTGCYGELSPQVRPPVDNLMRTLNHLNGTVMRVLKLLKADLRQGTMQWDDFLLSEAVQEARDTIGLFLDLRKQTLEIVATGPEIVLRADRSKVVDVLVNLLTNSIKFSKDGSVIRLVVGPSFDGWVRLCVEDQGVGISDDDLPRIFDRFFCSFDTEHHSSGSYQFGRRGVGLGLAIVKRFVELHSGTLDVASEVGRGTRISFTLPMAPGLQA